MGDAALRAVAERIAAPGLDRAAVALEIESRSASLGAEGLSFPTISRAARGARCRTRNRATSRSRRDGVVIDLGVIVDGYCSDLTRTIVLGAPDAKFREVYDIVLTAQRTAEEHRGPA